MIDAAARGVQDLDRGEAAERARQILSASKYRSRARRTTSGGGPSWFSEHIGDPIARFLERVADALTSPGGLVLGVVLAVLTALYIGRRRAQTAGRRSVVQSANGAADVPLDADALDAEALRAEAATDWALAIRLRFRAGLIRLHHMGALVVRPHHTTNHFQRSLRSEPFDALAVTFDEVTYGGRLAADRDAAQSRENWPRVIADARPADARRRS